MLVAWAVFLKFIAWVTRRHTHWLTHVVGSFFFCFFLTVEPWVLSLQVLYICYCHCHASGMERLPERDQPQTQKPMTKCKWRLKSYIGSNVHIDIPSFFREAAVGLERLSPRWSRSLSASATGSVWTSDSDTASISPPAHIQSHRRCYSTVNVLHLTFRAICIVVNCILWTDGNNGVLKGIMSFTAAFGRIYTIAIDWLVLAALCWAFGVFCWLFFFFFFTFWTIAEPVIRIFLL